MLHNPLYIMSSILVVVVAVVYYTVLILYYVILYYFSIWHQFIQTNVVGVRDGMMSFIFY